MDKISLLVADDEIIVRSFMRSVLEKISLPVAEYWEAADGAEAVRICRQQRPHAVFMDLRMPVLDGLAATAVILEELPETYITVISAHGEFSLVREAFKLGVKDYLLKPVGAAELSQLIQKICKSLGTSGAGGALAEDSLVKKVAQYTDEHIGEPFSINDLAKTLFVSSAHLNRKFKKLTGKCVINFIQERRIRKAVELLSDPTLSVTEVAELVGFSSPNYFATNFKSQMGKSPSSFRRALTIEEPDAN